MKTKYLATILISLAALSSCEMGLTPNDSSNSQTGGETTLVKTLASKVYFGTLESTYSLPCSFFSVAEDVPYIKFSDFFGGVHKEIITPGQETGIYTWSDSVVTNRLTKATMVFDVDNNTISTGDFDLFKSIAGETTTIHDDTFEVRADKSAEIVEDECSRIAGNAMIWDMDRYNMKLVSYENEVYAPYSVYQTLFFSRFKLNITFNGADFYLYDSLSVFADKDNNLTDYAKAIYDGPLAKISERSKSYSNYYYGSFLFTMETSNGKLPGKAFANDLDGVLKAYGLKDKMLSSDSDIADEALCDAVALIFADGGHTGTYGTGISVAPDTTREINYLRKVFATDERLKARQALSTALSAQRGVSEFKTALDHLKKSGQTAIITFDGFSLTSASTSPTKEEVESDNKSTFGILYNCFKEIEKDNSIKNVVLDVSLNGGGAVMALGQSLSFITNENITINTKDPVTGASNSETVRYDTDLDGDFTDDDSYAGKYDFYILTSPYSFSCGNAFPCIAKDNGWAKIIGQRSGGGDCAVGYAMSVDGALWQMSSPMMITREDGSSVDDGAAVDYTLDYSYFYDAAKLDSYLTNLPA